MGAERRTVNLASATLTGLTVLPNRKGGIDLNQVGAVEPAVNFPFWPKNYHPMMGN
jgi:hypothetical protein